MKNIIKQHYLPLLLITGKQLKKPGGQYRLNEATEQHILTVIDALAAWKVPLVGDDLRNIVKLYLDRNGVTDAVSYLKISL